MNDLVGFGFIFKVRFYFYKYFSADTPEQIETFIFIVIVN